MLSLHHGCNNNLPICLYPILELNFTLRQKSQRIWFWLHQVYYYSGTLNCMSFEYDKAHSIMWKHGVAPVNSLLPSLYGQSWETLEACIVQRLERNAFFSHMSEIFPNKPNQKYSIEPKWRYWVCARTIPKRVCSAQLAASCVIREPQKLPMKTNSGRPVFPENLAAQAFLTNLARGRVFAAQQLRQLSFRMSALTYIFYGKINWCGNIIQRIRVSNIYFSI